jgi:hypothetical protein
MKQATTSSSGIGSRRSLIMVMAILAALTTTLATFFSLGVKPAAAQDQKTSDANAEEASDDVNAELCAGFNNAVIERSPSALNFGKVKKGKSKQLDVTVRGITEGCTGIFEFGGGIGTPTISGAGASSYSILDNGCNNVSLDPQDTCTLTIRFKPTGKGQKTATLTIPAHDNGFTSFQGGNTVSLSGVGVKR